MINEHFELLEKIGLDFFFAAFLFFIGMAIKDVLNQGKVPPFGRYIVWLVLFLGCVGFISKGAIQFYLESARIAP
jgi:hypothetical protein